ncbi:hypothetical protein PISMIDRAFT_687505 [Pisolithus microcarpus 441]|uniref:Unplaced genomic scaffold scaffold_223, whole genome shotgun sequence n=1 Tax=Pisolithus microcarpus 441 TaxID=765257 RepID=A0A0C9Z522_9AGAM|nr:hypothetical protein PISMIDRAFT_687505 [Pisolithus microcarpus 441]
MDLNCQSTGERVGRDYKPDANHTPLETDTLNGSRSTRRVAILLWILALTEEHDREKHERQKMSMFWNQVEAHQCTTSGTREYTAYLANLPIDYRRRVEACKETQLVIHGQSHFPKSCEDQGPGVVMGRWEVNHNEPDCVSFWDWFKNMVRSSLGL